MSLVAISGNASGTGTLTIAAPNTNSNYTLNLPAAAGTVMVSGNMPAFSAYQSSAQTLSGGVATKITFTTEEFDTNSNYDTTTSRFTPTVAGYYQVNACVTFANATAAEQNRTQIYKNGAQAKIGNNATSTVNQGATSVVSALISMNGSTDYLEVYLFATGLGGTTPTNAIAGATYFQASMVRGA